MEKLKNLIIVIFGASGDLTSRKLIPAIFSLKVQNLMPEKYSILGVGRTNFSVDDFRKKMKEAIISFSEVKDPDAESIESFAEDLTYLQMENADEESYKGLMIRLSEISDEEGNQRELYFLSGHSPKPLRTNLCEPGQSQDLTSQKGSGG